MNQLSDAEIALVRDVFSLRDPTRSGKISSDQVAYVVRSVGFNATSSEIAV
jgi:Ca2+-binding EF-hand superfamily protein